MRFDSRQRQGFFSSKRSDRFWGPKSIPLKEYGGLFRRKEKRTGCNALYCPLFSAWLKNKWIYAFNHPPTPVCFYGAHTLTKFPVKMKSWMPYSICLLITVSFIKGAVNICDVGILFMWSNLCTAITVSCCNKVCTQHLHLQQLFAT